MLIPGDIVFNRLASVYVAPSPASFGHPTAQGPCDSPPVRKGEGFMAINDNDITTSGGGEGPADGGSNPAGHDGAADGTA
jgi:hypothetical protein